MHTRKVTGRVLIAAMLATLMPAPMAQAAATDPLIEGAKLCTRHLSRYEREYGIPTHLLSAISSTESGRYHNGLNIKVPWPWAINADGKGYFMDSKAEAMAMVKKLQKQGIKSIDVGCMQVNLYHHPHAFASLEEAFEPEKNIAYAASFLRSLYQETSSWKEAAGDYHSRTPSRGTKYVGLVYDSWYDIIDKLRMAKLQVPASTEVAMKEMRSTTGGVHVVSAPKSAVKAAMLPEQKGQQVAAYQSPRMNSISLSTKENPRDNGIIIVRPEIKVVDDEPIKASLIPAVAKVEVAQAMSVAPSSSAMSEAKVIRLDHQTVAKKSGPTFIFND